MLKKITPIIPVANLAKSIDFFEEYLGFSVGSQSDGYAYLSRDEVGIRLISAGDGVDTHDTARQISCYIDVENIDRLYEALKSKLETLPEGRVRAPFNQAYGQREFHVIDEDSLLMFFGEPVKQAK